MDDAEAFRALLSIPGGAMLLSLRHDPSAPNRRMFEVSAGEVIQLGSRNGLVRGLRQNTLSVGTLNRAAGVTWTRLAFLRSI
jgi:hypothetical protein